MTGPEARDLGGAREVTEDMRASWALSERQRRRAAVLRWAAGAVVSAFLVAVLAGVLGR